MWCVNHHETNTVRGWNYLQETIHLSHINALSSSSYNNLSIENANSCSCKPQYSVAYLTGFIARDDKIDEVNLENRHTVKSEHKLTTQWTQINRYQYRDDANAMSICRCRYLSNVTQTRVSIKTNTNHYTALALVKTVAGQQLWLGAWK